MAVEVPRRSPARQAGFRPGDILREVNGVAIERTAVLRRVLEEAPQQWRLAVERDGEIYRVAVR
jgi:S1-C subfamily serine protease